MHKENSFIQLSGVSRSFESAAGHFAALTDVNLRIERGEYVAIVGKSGSGKSTLLNMLTGIDHPDRGSVIVDGMRLEALGENELALWRGKNIGIVFQFFQLIPTLSILENILLAMEFVNVIPRKERRARAESLLNETGLTRHGNKFPGALSGGEQQRAATARALANDPPVLVADEPTGNLDSRTAQEVQEIFSRLSQAGKTIILVTHEKTSSRATRMITIHDGALISDDATVISDTSERKVQAGSL